MEHMEKLDFGRDIGTGLGFTLMGIFILNLYRFHDFYSVSILQWIGIPISIFGIAAMIMAFSKKDGSDFFNDLGAATIVFVPMFLGFLFSPWLWLKIIFSILTTFSLILVGVAMGRSLFKEDGSLRLDLKALPRVLLIVLSSSAALLSALASLSTNQILWSIF
jgi:hypothetical protein